MNQLALAMLFLAILAYLVNTYILSRNDWVFHACMACLMRCPEAYDRLPSYKDMVYRYCLIWDLKWFLDSKRSYAIKGQAAQVISLDEFKRNLNQKGN